MGVETDLQGDECWGAGEHCGGPSPHSPAPGPALKSSRASEGLLALGFGPLGITQVHYWYAMGKVLIFLTMLSLFDSK